MKPDVKPAAGVRRARAMAAVLLAFFAAGLAPSPAASAAEDERLIGWRGDTYSGNDSSDASGAQHGPVAAASSLSSSTAVSHATGPVTALSWAPRAFMAQGLVSPDEARHVVRVASMWMKRSVVVSEHQDNTTSQVQDLDVRTSYGGWLRRHRDPIVGALQERVAALTQLPVSHQEDMQVLRYGYSQQYKKHHDTIEDESPRRITVLVYLSTPTRGGETAFPRTTSADWADPSLEQAMGPLSQCAAGHVAMRAVQGSALMFHSFMANGTLDDMSEHAGCPVEEGVKWTATIWVHPKPYHADSYADDVARGKQKAEPPRQDPGLCEDYDVHCSKWAQEGECEKNRRWMVDEGIDDVVGECRLSCGSCEAPCAGPRDPSGCYNRNRAKYGYMEYDPDEWKTLV